jgi:hypothetical protein
VGARIDQFCEDLRQELTIADSGLDGLKVKINGNAAHVEQDVQSHIDGVHKRGPSLLRETRKLGHS